MPFRTLAARHTGRALRDNTEKRPRRVAQIATALRASQWQNWSVLQVRCLCLPLAGKVAAKPPDEVEFLTTYRTLIPVIVPCWYGTCFVFRVGNGVRAVPDVGGTTHRSCPTG